MEEFHGRPVGDLVLRGRSEALRAFEPVSGAQFKSEAVTNYLEAFSKLEANDPSAVSAFAALVAQNPDDRLASFHLKRLLNGAKGTRIVME